MTLQRGEVKKLLKTKQRWRRGAHETVIDVEEGRGGEGIRNNNTKRRRSRKIFV